MEAPGKNALGTELMDRLLSQLEQAGGEPVLLTGAGDAFSAGLNLKEVHALDPAGMERFLIRLEALVEALHGYAGPTVAFVNGHAIAGGCILALCCDHRVAVADAKVRIGLNEVALGLRFPPGVLRLVRERVSPAHVTEVLLGAGLHAPEHALRLALVDELGDGDVARARLSAMAAHPADALAATKHALRGSLRAPGDEETLKKLLPVWTSEQLKQRIAGALKKK